MQAFIYNAAHALQDFEITLGQVPDPVCGPKDLLVAVKAFSVNPVDCKVRQSRSASGNPVILGWDAAGVVEAVGREVRGFSPGDEVYYAGDLNRAGSYASKQAVDYRLVAHKPTSVDFTDAAALPLTSLTAYEALFERGIQYDEKCQVVIIGGAGGVGSIAIQLLKAFTQASVIATASRPESIEWTRFLGADRIVGRDVAKEIAAEDIGAVDVIFSTTHTADYIAFIPDLLRPFGHLIVIDDPAMLDIRPFKPKALSVHWEFMFAKSTGNFRPESQGKILAEVAKLVDAGKLRTTRTVTLSAETAKLKAIHRALEAGSLVGKTVVRW